MTLAKRPVRAGSPLGGPRVRTSPVSTARAHGSRTAAGYRPDIQGLRAVAVVLVVATHLTGHPVGGFIGVDVFFVVSGFLITGVLLRRSDTHGRVSLLHFYKARARRILPASLVVLATCWVVAHLLFNGVRIRENTTDTIWALGFAANIHYQQIGTDYFRTGQAPSLEQHYWSLAVEEQYYLIWPLVILLVLTCAAPIVGSRRARLLTLGTVIAGASVISVTYAWQQTSTDPTQAYFSTLSRAWELGIGATLAVVIVCFPRLSETLGRARGPLSLLGIAVVVGSAFVIGPTPGFPAPAAIVPVLATALVLLAGASGSTGRWFMLLTNPLSVYLGLVSYSLYLWHWPTIIVAETLVPTKDPLFYAMVLCAITALTVFSYHFIESPFRDQGFRAMAERGFDRGPRHSRILLGAATAAVLAAACYTLKPEPVVPDYTGTAADVSQTTTTANTHVAPAPPILSRGISDALQASAFPTLKPDLDHLGLQPAEHDWRGCNTDSAILRTCVFRPTSGAADPAKVAVVLGDSIALSWLPAVRAALTPKGWTVYGLARQQCSVADAPQIALTAAQAAGCDRLHAFYPTAAKTIKPTLVIMSSVEGATFRLRDKARGFVGLAHYRAAVAKTVKIFTGPHTRTVNLSAPPAGKGLTECDTAAATPATCVGVISKLWRTQSDADAAVAAATDTGYVDTNRWFCSTNGYCPAFNGHTPIRYDGEHLTKQYAASLAGPLSAVLLPD